MLATLIGFLGDFDLAEEAAQAAFARAAERWPRDGRPATPGAWLDDDGAPPSPSTACAATARWSPRRGSWSGARGHGGRGRRDRQKAIPDERLELIFTCCHPALALDAQVALTLRTLGRPVDRARSRAPSSCPEATMAQRLVRAKRKIKTAPASPSAFRPSTCCPSASTAVLAVVYLIFNEGFAGRERARGRGVSASAAPSPRCCPTSPRRTACSPSCCSHDARARRAHARRRARAPPRPGSLAVGRGRDRGGAAAPASSDRARRPPRLRAAGGDRRRARRRAARLGAHRRPLRRARGAHRLAGRRRSTAPWPSPPRVARRLACELVDGLDLDDYRYLHATRAELLRRLGRTDDARARLRARPQSRIPTPSACFSSVASDGTAGHGAAAVVRPLLPRHHPPSTAHFRCPHDRLAP